MNKKKINIYLVSGSITSAAIRQELQNGIVIDLHLQITVVFTIIYITHSYIINDSKCYVRWCFYLCICLPV